MTGRSGVVLGKSPRDGKSLDEEKTPNHPAADQIPDLLITFLKTPDFVSLNAHASAGKRNDYNH